MHWDYWTYEKQPPFFIEELAIFMKQEALREEDEIKKIKNPMVKGKGIKR